MLFPTREELEVQVIAKADFTGHWDGKELDFSKGITVQRGIVHHYEKQGIQFELSDVPKQERDARAIVNPLEENDRGEAFAGLKRKPKPKDGE